MYVTVFAIANSESHVGRVALFRISFIVREEGSREGRERGIAAFTSNKIPANLSTLQPQRQNSSVEIGDRGVGYRGGSTGEQGGGWTVERGGGPDGTGCSG